MTPIVAVHGPALGRHEEVAVRGASRDPARISTRSVARRRPARGGRPGRRSRRRCSTARRRAGAHRRPRHRSRLLRGGTPRRGVRGRHRGRRSRARACACAVVERATPTLAICRGLQVLNVALGGTLHQHIPDLPGIERHGRPGEAGGAWEHGIDVLPESLLASVFGTTRVPRVPVTTIKRSTRSAPACASRATADDGIVEGLEVEGTWLLAVQWHPRGHGRHRPDATALVRRAEWNAWRLTRRVRRASSTARRLSWRRCARSRKR